MLKKANSEGLSAVGQILMGLFQAVREVIGFDAFLAFVAIFNFYLLLDKDRVQPFVINSIWPKYRKQAADVLKKMDTALGGLFTRPAYGSSYGGPDVCRFSKAIANEIGDGRRRGFLVYG